MMTPDVKEPYYYSYHSHLQWEDLREGENFHHIEPSCWESLVFRCRSCASQLFSCDWRRKEKEPEDSYLYPPSAYQTPTALIAVSPPPSPPTIEVQKPAPTTATDAGEEKHSPAFYEQGNKLLKARSLSAPE